MKNQNERDNKSLWFKINSFLQNHLIIILGLIIGIIIGFFQNQRLNTQNQLIELNSKQMSEINHQLSEKRAYFNKALIDGARDRETEYYKLLERNNQIINYCKNNNCNLPYELKSEIPQKTFIPIETVLLLNN